MIKRIAQATLLLLTLGLGACAGTTNMMLDGVARIDEKVDRALGPAVVSSSMNISNSTTRSWHWHRGDSRHRTTCTDDYNYNRSQYGSFDSYTGDLVIDRYKNRSVNEYCYGRDVYRRP